MRRVYCQCPMIGLVGVYLPSETQNEEFRVGWLFTPEQKDGCRKEECLAPGGGATHRLPPSVREVLPQQQTQLGGDGHVGVTAAAAAPAPRCRHSNRKQSDAENKAESDLRCPKTTGSGVTQTEAKETTNQRVKTNPRAKTTKVGKEIFNNELKRGKRQKVEPFVLFDNFVAPLAPGRLLAPPWPLPLLIPCTCLTFDPLCPFVPRRRSGRSEKHKQPILTASTPGSQAIQNATTLLVSSPAGGRVSNLKRSATFSSIPPSGGHVTSCLHSDASEVNQASLPVDCLSTGWTQAHS